MDSKAATFLELTFRVRCSPLTEYAPGNIKVINSSTDYCNEKWLITLTRNKQKLNITVQWNSSQQTYYDTSGYCRQKYLDGNGYRVMHFVPSGNRIARNVRAYWSGQQVKMEVPLEEAIHHNDYQFDIILSPEEKLCRGSKTDETEFDMKDFQKQTQLIMKTLLGDIHSVDTQFIFSTDKTYSNIGLWAHRSILSRHKGFANLIEKTIKSRGGNGTEPGFLTIHIGDFTLATFCCLLQYLYTGEIGRSIDSNNFAFSTLDPAEVVVRDTASGRVKDSVKWNPLEPASSWQLKDVRWTELLFLSDHFGITSLRSRCMENVIKSIDNQNVIETLFEVGCSFKEVKTAGLDFVANNKHDLFKDSRDPFEDFQGRKECYALMVERSSSSSPINQPLVPFGNLYPFPSLSNARSSENSRDTFSAVMKHIGSKSELDSQLTAAGSRLVVVDFFATWCGPCITLAPMLESLERKHNSTVFAKIDVDTAQDCAGEYKVTAMPTIVFFKNSSEVGRVVGANVSEIQAMIKKHEGGDAFSGTGLTLGGSSSTGSSNSIGSGSTSASTNTRTVEGPGGSCQIQVRLLDGSTVRGNFEPTHTIQQVHDFVTANLDARGVSAPGFTLMTNFPKMQVVYENDALQQTLLDAKLTPRAQLIVKA
ncbi:hypothetical protein BGZ51_005619 [Haplosporangium sp. Z 767]|nr:hypothetical protein BGZ50_000724 [Haplosporangium sp. Z 11]KAF9192425.1 hypothetical protein BGZ51_005619 [Haplosporangium sp. Z 767]